MQKDAICSNLSRSVGFADSRKQIPRRQRGGVQKAGFANSRISNIWGLGRTSKDLGDGVCMFPLWGARAKDLGEDECVCVCVFVCLCVCAAACGG